MRTWTYRENHTDYWWIDREILCGGYVVGFVSCGKSAPEEDREATARFIVDACNDAERRLACPECHGTGLTPWDSPYGAGRACFHGAQALSSRGHAVMEDDDDPTVPLADDHEYVAADGTIIHIPTMKKITADSFSPRGHACPVDHGALVVGCIGCGWTPESNLPTW